MDSLLDILNSGVTVIFGETDYADELDAWDETDDGGYFDIKPTYSDKWYTNA